MRSRFHDDWTLESETHHGRMRYTMQVDEHSVLRESCVQVENFPVLESSRLEDGRWRIENVNAIFTQPVHSEKDLSPACPLF